MLLQLAFELTGIEILGNSDPRDVRVARNTVRNRAFPDPRRQRLAIQRQLNDLVSGFKDNFH